MERGGVGDSETKAARDGRAIIGVSFAASRRQAFHLLCLVGEAVLLR